LSIDSVLVVVGVVGVIAAFGVCWCVLMSEVGY
jgi:hypothetical protein